MTDELVDTDIFIDHLRGFRQFSPGDGESLYSVVTRCELFAGARADEKQIDTLLGPFRELPIDRRIAERAGRLRRESGTKIVDALIAATALEHRLTLVTRNLSHFGRIPALRLRAPDES